MRDEEAEDMVVCERYHCRLPSASCAARWRNAREPLRAALYPDGLTGCFDCPVGERLNKEGGCKVGKVEASAEVKKRCKVCGELKPVDEYHRDRDGKHGRKAVCKQCLAARHKAQRDAAREALAEMGDAEGLFVNLGAYQGLFARLKAAAHDHVRSVEHQALFYIVEGVGKDEG